MDLANENVRAPWRRFFARNLDLFLCSALWAGSLALCFGVNITALDKGDQLLLDVMSVSLMLFLEPACLALFGTTPGKAALGLCVLSCDGQRLHYSEGLARTWKVLLYGMALNIPFLNLYRFWKSYRTCAAGETPEWEWDSTQTLKDEKLWRAAACVGVFAFGIFLLLCVALVAEQPVNRGKVSVAQFAENYDRYMDYYGIDNGRRLNDAGAWVEQQDPNVYYCNGYEEPAYSYTVKNGVMTSLSFTSELHGKKLMPPNYQDEMTTCVLAFARALPGRFYAQDIRDAIQKINDTPNESFTYNVRGVTLRCEVKYNGFTNYGGDSLVPDGDGEEDWSFRFWMA